MTQREIQKAIYRFFERGIENPARVGGYAGVVEAARTLRLAAAALDRVNLSRCNGVSYYDSQLGRVMQKWDDADEAAAQRKEARHEKRAREAVAAMFGDAVSVALQGDPRGASVRLYVGAADDSRSADLYI